MSPRPPHSAFDGERLPGIGHNAGPPLDPNKTWRTHCWTTARKALLPRLPLEVVRRRVRRAKELGLEYPAYASILLGTGRDVVAFLFTADALHLKLEATEALPTVIADKLTRISGCERMLAADADRDPARLAAQLQIAHGIPVAGTASLPPGDASWHAGRKAIREALAPLKLPSDTVVMIGTRTQERTWADAATLAAFMPAERYFGAT